LAVEAVKGKRTGRLCGLSGKERPVRRLNAQDSLVISPARSFVVATAAIINGVPVPPFGLPGAFLDAADQFVLLAVNELQVIVGNLRQCLF
jgi:hypothetical protein